MGARVGSGWALTIAVASIVALAGPPSAAAARGFSEAGPAVRVATSSAAPAPSAAGAEPAPARDASGAAPAPVRVAVGAGGSGRSVLFITAHPDDETMFGLGRFVERDWQVHVVVVTSGEGGQVVQAVREAPTGEDPLVEHPPGSGVQVVTTPPAGPSGRPVGTPADLARQRQSELRVSMAWQDVTDVRFLSDPGSPDYEDSWDRGVTRWDRPRLRRQLARVAAAVDPDVVVTLNPGETWAHPQHVGLGRIVQRMWRNHRLDDAGRRPALYGLREHGWYERSRRAQSGDETFDRLAHSPVLGMTYAEYWRQATGAYLSQSSHPVWFAARVDAGILPGYDTVDVIRRLGRGTGGTTLTGLLAGIAGLYPTAHTQPRRSA